LCADADCKIYLSKSLFIVGEFGFHDYNAALFTPGKGIAEARNYMPQVVDRNCRLSRSSRAWQASLRKPTGLGRHSCEAHLRNSGCWRCP
jgi:hypothetical protein